MTMTPPPLAAEHIRSLRPYVPGKSAEELERELGIRNAVKLASNENPMGPSPLATEAAVRSLSEAHRYPDGGYHLLREALAGHLGCEEGEVCLGHGSNEVIDLLFRTFTTAEDHVVFASPSFVCYELGCRINRIPFTAVALRDNLHWNMDDLLGAVRRDTKLLFVANPNNPTGTHVAKGELARLVRNLPPQVILVVDEAYHECVTADDLVSAMTMRHMRERLMVLRTFSKAYGLAAYRVGLGVAPFALVDLINRVRPPFNVSSPAQAAALAALDDREHLVRFRENNARELARMTSALEDMGHTVAPSQGNFVLVDVKRDAVNTYDSLLKKGVIVRPMGPPVHTMLRVTVGLPDDNQRFLDTLQAIDDQAH